MISFVVAMDRNGVIGYNQRLPWHLPADLQYFKKLTTGHPVIMGRKTFESIGKPLPGRRNIVMTHQVGFNREGVEVYHSADELLDSRTCYGRECFIIGGARIFDTFAAFADRMYITLIDAEFEGDTYYTAFHADEWKLVSRTEGQVDRKNIYPHTFFVYERY